MKLRDANQPLRFGVFEAYLQAGELHKQGKVKLAGQAFQALALLIERPGAVVTREEFRKAVWPAETLADFERGLNEAIRKIREALGDDAGQPRFIETLPDGGYRFIAPVDGAQAAATSSQRMAKGGKSAPGVTTGQDTRREKWLAGLIIGIGMLLLSLLMLAGAYWLYHYGDRLAPVSSAAPRGGVLTQLTLVPQPGRAALRVGMVQGKMTLPH